MSPKTSSNSGGLIWGSDQAAGCQNAFCVRIISLPQADPASPRVVELRQMPLEAPPSPGRPIAVSTETVAEVSQPRAVKRSIAPSVAVLLLLAGGHFPLLQKFFSDLGDRPQYAFYPMLLLAAVWLTWDRLRDLPAAAVRNGSWLMTGSLLTLSLALSSIGAIFYFRWLAAGSAWLTLAAIVWRIGGKSLARQLLPVGILLLVIVPLPAHRDIPILEGLQRIAVQASSRVLDVLNVPNLMTGTVIEIPGHRLLVEEACSGINSLMAVIAFTLLFGFLQRRSVARLVMLLVTAIGFVIWTNIARIVLGAAMLSHFQINMLQNSVHELTGLLMFAIALGLVLSADQFMALIIDKKPPPLEEPAPINQSPAPHALARPGAAWWAFACAFAVVGAMSYARVHDCWPASRLSDSAVFSPPAQVGDWKLIDGSGSPGQRLEAVARYQHHWVYRSGDIVAEICFSYPFGGYHDAFICYGTTGWSINRRTTLTRPDPITGSARSYFAADMAKVAEGNGYLLYSGFDEAGRWDDPRSEPAPDEASAESFRMSRDLALRPPTCEVQALTVSNRAIDQNQKDHLAELFVGVREAVRSQTVTQTGR